MRRPLDTSADARRRQLAALRQMTPEERLAAGASMSDEVRALAEAGIRARHPEYSTKELREAVAAVMLGDGPGRNAGPDPTGTA